MAREGRVLVEDLCFPEGPRWHEDALWFSDMHAHHVLRMDAEDHCTPVVEVPRCPSGLGWDPSGRLLVVSMEDHRLLRQEPDGTLHEVADLSGLATHLSNDMVVDGRGRAYVGNFGFDLHGGGSPRKTNLLLATPDGGVREVASDLSFPNGAVILPDEHTLVLAETFAFRLTAFDIGPDGSLSGPRVWAQLEGAAPDGICLDAEGAIWVASPISAEALRVQQGGRVLARIPVETQAFACMLGGPAGRTLYLCTANDSDPERCRTERSGRIEAFEVDVPRAGRP